jgi:hypothetical protein
MQKGLTSILNKINSKNWFEKALEDIYLKGKRQPRAIEYFYGSWAGDCPRAIQYSMKGLMPDDIDAQGKRRMDNGNYMHNRYGDYFESIGILVAREPAFKDELNGIRISLRSDLILLDDNKNKVMAELKSINDRKYKLVLESPDEGDYLQWNLCAKALGYLSGIILYENKNTQEVKYHFVEYREDKFKKVMDDFIMIDKHNKAGTWVPRPEKCPNSYWCGCKKICK